MKGGRKVGESKSRDLGVYGLKRISMKISVWAKRERESEIFGRLAKMGCLALPRSGWLTDYH